VRVVRRPPASRRGGEVEPWPSRHRSAAAGPCHPLGVNLSGRTVTIATRYVRTLVAATSRSRLIGPQGCEAALHALWRRAGYRSAAGVLGDHLAATCGRRVWSSPGGQLDAVGFDDPCAGCRGRVVQRPALSRTDGRSWRNRLFLPSELSDLAGCPCASQVMVRSSSRPREP
jgi:hypothetical protein